MGSQCIKGRAQDKGDAYIMSTAHPFPLTNKESKLLVERLAGLRVTYETLVKEGRLQP